MKRHITEKLRMKNNNFNEIVAVNYVFRILLTPHSFIHPSITLFVPFLLKANNTRRKKKHYSSSSNSKNKE